MKMKHLVILLLVLAAGCATPKYESWVTCVPREHMAEQFYLIDAKSGETFGRFTLTNGATAVVQDRTLVLQLEEPRTRGLELLMKQTVIPEIDFRAPDLEDVFQFFAECWKNWCPQPDKRDLSFVLLGKGLRLKRINLQMRYKNLFEAVTVVCDMCGLTYRIDYRGIVFIFPKAGKQIVFDDEGLIPPVF